MVTPFLTEAVQEEMNHLESLERELEEGLAKDSSYLEPPSPTIRMAENRVNNFFTFTNPQANKVVETISVAQSLSSV